MYNKFVKLVESTLNKVGKNTKSEWYGHIDSVKNDTSNINDRQKEKLQKAMEKMPEDFEYDIVAISNMNNQVRFLKLNSLEDPHPYTVNSMTITNNGDVKQGKDKTNVEPQEGKKPSQIFHRLDTIIDPNHPTYKFHVAVTDFERDSGFLQFENAVGKKQAPSGHYHVWLRQIENKSDIIEQDLIDKWTELKNVYLN